MLLGLYSVSYLNVVIFNNGLFMKFYENGNSFFNIMNHSKINMRL